jgi:hypothetical protein
MNVWNLISMTRCLEEGIILPSQLSRDMEYYRSSLNPSLDVFTILSDILTLFRCMIKKS